MPHVASSDGTETRGKSIRTVTPMKISKFLRLVFAILFLLPTAAWSGAALFIHPTLVMFEGNERSATITLTNRGDETGTFETSWIDYTMLPKGGLKKMDGLASWSVQPYVRYSPRRVTLAPAESQVVKVALRRRKDIAPGEYYSHFRVLTLNSEDPANNEAKAAELPENITSVTIKTRTAIAIPIIWRNSQESSGATIESVDFDRQTRTLAVDVRRHGHLSVRGFLSVFDVAPDGTRRSLAQSVPLNIYPILERRTIDITLDEGISPDSLANGVTVLYAPELEGINQATVIASYPVTL